MKIQSDSKLAKEMEEDDLRVARRHPMSLDMLDHEPTDRVKEVAIKKNPFVIQIWLRPSKELQWLAVKLRPDVLPKIDNPRDDVSLYALEKQPDIANALKGPLSFKVKKALENLQELTTVSSLILNLENLNEFSLAKKIRKIRNTLSEKGN